MSTQTKCQEEQKLIKPLKFPLENRCLRLPQTILGLLNPLLDHKEFKFKTLHVRKLVNLLN